MSHQPPPIDPRTASGISQQLVKLIEQYTRNEEWKDYDSNTNRLNGVSSALIGVFLRYTEIIIQRLNQVPQKNFLAFLNLLGVSQLPPQPARVPLSFFLSTGSEADSIVPRGTQVAAQATEGETEPVIFETECDLLVTAAKIEAVYVREPNEDKYANYSEIIDIDYTSAGEQIFAGQYPIEHILYLGHSELLNFLGSQSLTLTINVATPMGDNTDLIWQLWDGKKWQDKETAETPNLVGAKNLRLSGDNQFLLPRITSPSKSRVNGFLNRWLRCKLRSPIKITSESQGLASINNINLKLNVKCSSLPIEEAFTNELPIDLTKTFFPFGEYPKFGDTFYLASAAAFSQSGNVVIVLRIGLINPLDIGIDKDIIDNWKKKENKDKLKLKLKWEIWDGKVQKWRGVGISTPESSEPVESEEKFVDKFIDKTKALTNFGRIRRVYIRLNENFIPTRTTVNGVENFWIRVRIIAGDYGKEVSYKYDHDSTKFEYQSASIVPPAIESLTVGYRFRKESQPEKIITYNDFLYQQPNCANFKPFEPMEDTKPTIYLGFSLPTSRPFSNLPLSLFIQTVNYTYGDKLEPVTKQNIPVLLSWEYWNGEDWNNLTVRDSSRNFTRSGVVEFIPPYDFKQKKDFGFNEYYWLRVRWKNGNYNIEPKLQRILLNTTMASQVETIDLEIIGSSNGDKNQSFRTRQSPILSGEYLEVRESEMPSLQGQIDIEKAINKDDITVITDSNGSPEEIWVRWQEVPDFHASSNFDRHYVINRIAGTIYFGDGLNGRIPPVGIGNLRIRNYRTGGGKAGNKGAKTIVQLKTTVPYIDRVINPEPATGGIDAETLDSLMERAPRAIRHQKRAVTWEDYEDLAMLASPAVARAKCFPLLDLDQNPLDQKPEGFAKAPGTVSVIIVPRSQETKPLPSLELLQRVQSYLKAHASPIIEIRVVGPLYIKVSVTAEIGLEGSDRASTAERGIHQALNCFLHPLTGGVDGLGWVFGRTPHESDFYALLKAVPGVDYIRELKVKETVDEGDVKKIIKKTVDQENVKEIIKETVRFLVYSGEHKISFRF